MNMGNSKTEINSGFNLKWLYGCVFFTQVVPHFPGLKAEDCCIKVQLLSVPVVFHKGVRCAAFRDCT